MNQDSKENLWLVDHLHKCRCCFEMFDHNENQFKITEIIEEQFLELTQIELKTSPNFSNTICSKCASELQSISNFRLNLITKQQQLYDFVITSPYKIQDDIKFETVNIKIETQTSDEINSMFHFGNSFEEIKIPELPFISTTTEDSKARRKSPRQPNIQQPKVQTNIQKITKTNVKAKVQIKTKTEVETKLQNQPGNSKSMCPECGLIVNANYLSRHIRLVHLKIKRFFCDFCSYGSLLKCKLVEHMNIHTMREKMYCSNCKFETISKIEMKRHLRNDHGTKSKKIDQISECYCGKVFSSIQKLKTHKKNTHLSERNHICRICSKAYLSRQDLKKHFLIKHIGIVRKREKACDVCGKMFINLSQLRKHSVQHKDPQFICSFDGCTKKCFTQVTLESHKKTHIDQRDYACQLCDKKYFMSNHLSRHVKNFHRQLKISCELPGCTSKFARKETYRNHVFSHHKDLSQEKVQALLKKIRELKQE